VANTKPMTSKKPTTLSKSRFKLALECPTKVFYSLDKRYVNAKNDDEFLQALADGGFQVGALAKAMFEAEDPAAVEVTIKGDDAQVEETAALLARDNVTIFEGTIRHGNLLARVDVLRKRGNVVELIEVKSKSFDPTKPSKSFLKNDGDLRPEWAAYLQDVAFQTYVFRKAYPALEVKPFLFLVDPTVTCGIDGLGAAIRVERDADDRAVVTVDPGLNVKAIKPALLKQHDVGTLVTKILGGIVEVPGGAYDFTEFVDRMAALVAAGKSDEPVPGKQCKKCEYYCEPSERSATVRSGWAECMEKRFPGRGGVERTATVFGLYNYSTVGELLAKGKLLLSELNDEDIKGEAVDGEITSPHRNRLQIREAREGAAATLLRKKALRDAFNSWKWPLHFIDFETSKPTLPFTAGRRPNQQLLFQFSHHVLGEDGKLEHKTQCLVAEPGVVPNAAVVRALRDALSGDLGTVLHWWDHERTVLEDVGVQLTASSEPDRDALVAFIQGLIAGVDGRPPRLVDMGRPLVARTAFIAGTEGRSSIKKVLQAVMAQSEYLRQQYSRPVYGTVEMPSLNVRDWTWWRQEHGQVRDPYTLLGQLLQDPGLDDEARAQEDDGEASPFVANGGAAMVAYGELQQRDLPTVERQRLEGQLLRYCELDTLAMVMVYEALREWAE
jgi:hypothetical protein